MKYKELKEAACQANKDIAQRGLAVFSFGNASAFDAKAGLFAIKPAGVPYDRLTAEQMVVVDLDMRKADGSLEPASGAQTHAVLYKNLQGLGGICHTRSVYATAWAQARRSIPVYGITHADHLPCDVPCAELPEQLTGDYDAAAGQAIADLFAASEIIVSGISMGNMMGESAVIKSESALKPLEVPMVLAAGLGPFAWGADAQGAVLHAFILEELAKIAFASEQINPKLPRLGQDLIQTCYARRHSGNAYYKQPEF